jgi:hypothetical protein
MNKIKSEIKAIEKIFSLINQKHGKFASIIVEGFNYHMKAGYIVELKDGIEFKPYNRFGEFLFNINTVKLEDLRNAKKKFKTILNR